MWCTGARVRRHTAASSMHPLDAPRFLHCRPSRRPAMGGWNSHDDSLELWNSGELQTTHIRINRSFQAAIMVNALPKRVWVKIGYQQWEVPYGTIQSFLNMTKIRKKSTYFGVFCVCVWVLIFKNHARV